MIIIQDVEKIDQVTFAEQIIKLSHLTEGFRAVVVDYTDSK